MDQRSSCLRMGSQSRAEKDGLRMAAKELLRMTAKQENSKRAQILSGKPATPPPPPPALAITKAAHTATADTPQPAPPYPCLPPGISLNSLTPPNPGTPDRVLQDQPGSNSPTLPCPTTVPSCSERKPNAFKETRSQKPLARLQLSRSGDLKINQEGLSSSPTLPTPPGTGARTVASPARRVGLATHDVRHTRHVKRPSTSTLPASKCQVDNCAWSVTALPSPLVSLYVDASGGRIPCGCPFEYAITVVNHRDVKLNRTLEGGHTFSEGKPAYCVTTDIPLSELFAPSAGWMRDNAMTVKVKVTVMQADYNKLGLASQQQDRNTTQPSSSCNDDTQPLEDQREQAETQEQAVTQVVARAEQLQVLLDEERLRTTHLTKELQRTVPTQAQSEAALQASTIKLAMAEAHTKQQAEQLRKLEKAQLKSRMVVEKLQRQLREAEARALQAENLARQQVSAQEVMKELLDQVLAAGQGLHTTLSKVTASPQ